MNGIAGKAGGVGHSEQDEDLEAVIEAPCLQNENHASHTHTHTLS